MSGWFYHRECLKCLECNRGSDADSPMMLGQLELHEDDLISCLLGPMDSDNVFAEEELAVFCKFCFAKRYKMSALNIAETVKIV